MFRRLIINTALSAGAFLAISIVGLLLTPLIVRAHGLAAYGLVTLARLFLPNGVLALVDLGLSEVTIQVVARAREKQDWRSARAQLTLLGLASIGMGLLAALLLGMGGNAVTVLLNTPPPFADQFARVLLFTAAALPVLFVSLVAEGCLKGFERYEVVRVLEVAATLLYAGLTIAVVLVGGPFEQVALAYVLAQTLRALAAIALATMLLRRYGLRPASWNRADRRDVFARSKVLTYARLIGSLQGQAPPLLIAAIFGPAATGIYDVLTRLPKFLKTVLALISSTLLPVAVRLDVSNNAEGTRRLGETGLLLIAFITLPLVTAGMFFSKEILQLWIGPAVSDEWPWLALMFVQPVLMALVGFGSNVLLGRLPLTRKLNAITTLQVLLQIVLSLALAPMLREKAFILGQILAICSTFPLSMSVIIRAQGLSRHIYIWLAQGALIATGVTILFIMAPRPENLGALAGYGAVWASLAAAGLWAWAGRERRQSLLRILAVLLPKRVRQVFSQ